MNTPNQETKKPLTPYERGIITRMQGDGLTKEQYRELLERNATDIRIVEVGGAVLIKKGPGAGTRILPAKTTPAPAPAPVKREVAPVVKVEAKPEHEVTAAEFAKAARGPERAARLKDFAPEPGPVSKGLADFLSAVTGR